ncbi:MULTISPECIES: GTP-binding protein [unclassified Clostridium]|uniref:TIGR03943 family putative permease subunit n=1 Tax=unclassified Clostridium TaxID=2614128 RepID=UPI0002984FE3|nr:MULTISPECIES: GTP-binding protein [unclassified Clostridium]EKQ57178.1 MAG: putative GTPase, G3E family [Clostridium sp. Maddingley MBC34-26]
MTDIPVFVVTGFLEGGKTTFVKEIFNDPDFVKGEKITLIVCENGIEEYEEEFLNKNNVKLVSINDKEELNKTRLKEINEEQKPTKILIEYNGMWEFDIIEKLELPKGWVIAQILTPIDASTFDNYLNNMKSLLVEQFKESNLIVFNRCSENTNKLKFRNSVKAINPRANIIFELENGEIDDSPLELPFDINANIIEFKDYDFGAWYLDVTENPEKYEGKKIKTKGIAYINPKYPKGIFAFGRNAMTCCEDDITFLGLLCQTTKSLDFDGQKWVEIEGIIHRKYIQHEEREIPFISISNYKFTDTPEEELVYF